MKNKVLSAREAVTNLKLTDVQIEELYAKASIPAKKEGERRAIVIKERYPELTQTEMLNKLQRRYITEVTSAGAAVGAAAAVPGVGTVTALTAGSMADATAWLLSTSTLVYGMLKILDTQFEDLDYERNLVMGIILGTSVSGTMKEAAGRTGQHWGKAAVKKIPGTSLKPVNKVLGRNFVTKAGSTGVVRLSTALPFGIGAAIGGTMNYAVARGTIKAIRAALASELGRDELNDKVEDLLEAEVVEGEILDISGVEGSKNTGEKQ